MSIDWKKLVGELVQARPQLELPKRLKLPVLPQSVIAFTAIADDPNAGPWEMAVPLEADSALTSELLRQVNSAAVGLRQRVVSVPQAINLLGPRRTKTLVLTSALQTAAAPGKSRLMNVTQFQKENRIRAIFARETAREIGADSEYAYAAGLLQDFLLPLLIEAFSSDYREMLRGEGELIEHERQRFGWDHAQVAAALMHDWGLPDELVCAVWWHHDAERILNDESLRATSVAAALAAGSLPDSVNQSPAGFDVLLRLQDLLENFRFLEVANVVDEELNAGNGQADEPTGLCERLGNLAVANLEQRRLDRVHHYRQLGNYTLEEQIGQGGMGVVYRASHCMLKRPAAVKVLQSAKISPRALSRFETEVQLTCRLTNPHTVAVYDYGVTSEGLFYYVMEYLDGITLAKLVLQHGPQPAGRVISLLQQACCSLAEAHSIGLIHRDLKPENLMLCCRGGVPDMLKVLDFGLARLVSDHPERDDVPVGLSGTPLYMPPEAINAPQSVDVRSDLYSLAAVGYFLLTGTDVFLTQELNTLLRSHLYVVPQRPSERLGRPIDRDLEDLLLRCLAKSPEQRVGSAQQFSLLLGQCRAAGSWTTQLASDWWAQYENAQRVEMSATPANSPHATTVLVGA